MRPPLCMARVPAEQAHQAVRQAGHDQHQHDAVDHEAERLDVLQRRHDARQATRDLGVDVLSFGGTKNGAMGGEAVVFFNPKLAEDFQFLRKQGMQLASKMRFIAVQFEVLL